MESTNKGNRKLAVVKVLIPKLEKKLADEKLQVAGSSKLQKSVTFANSKEELVNNDSIEIVNHWDQEYQDKGHEGGDLLLQLLGGGLQNQPQMQNMQMDAYYSNDDSIDIKVEVLPSLDYLMPEMDLMEYDANPNEAMIVSKPTKPPKPKTHFCPICKSVGVDRAYSKPSLLRAHLLYHKKTGRAILTPGHARIVEAEGAIYSCDTCKGRTFNSRKAFNQHKTFHRFLVRKYGKDREVGSRDRTNIIPIQDIYNCSFCHKQFEDRKKFLIHLKAHRRNERQGEIEGQGQARKRSRWSLIPHPDEVQEYKCDICGKTYPPKSRAAYRCHLKRHKEIQAEEEKKKRRMESMRPDIPVADSYHCEMCDRNWVADKRISYINHIKIHENLEKKGMNRPIAEKKEKGSDDEEEEQDFYCTTCDKHFNDKIRFRGHMHYHKVLQAKGRDRPIRSDDQVGITPTSSWKDEIPHDLEKWLCETCPSRTFDDRDSYISHLSIHRSLKKKGCDRPILTREEWSTRSQKETSCSECNETFESARAYQDHCREVHPKQKREAGTNWSELVPEQDTYSCSTCVTRTFDSRNAYITHLKIHKRMSRRGEDRPIMSKEQWSQHMRELKAEGKSKSSKTSQNFTCTTCNKSFWKRLAYKNHMRYHQILKRKGQDRVIGERPKSWKEDIPHQASYKCEKCPDREFTERNSFIGHLNYHKMLERKGKGSAPIARRKREFTGELKCTICDRTFEGKNMYKGHMNYHYYIRKKTGEDRKIGRKSEIQFLGHVGGTGEPVADLMSLMMNDLDGKFVCGCGEKFYFGDALEHHLNLKKSQDCRKMEKIKEEPKDEVIEHEDLDLVNDDENIENDKENNNEIPVQEVINTSNPSTSRLIEQNQEQEVEDEMETSIIDPIPEILIVENGIQNQNGNETTEDEEMIDEPHVDYEFEDVYTENNPFPINLQVNENEDDGPELKIEVVETKITPVIVTVNPQQQLKTVSQSVTLEPEEEDDTLAAFYQCQTCDAENPSLTEYLKHQYEQHLIDQSSPLPCPFCALQFTLGSELLVHCKEEHNEISSVREFNAACPSCGVFISIVEGPEFEQHFKSNHPKLVCRMCSKMVSAAPALNKHIVSEHLKKKPTTPVITSVKGNQ